MATRGVMSIMPMRGTIRRSGARMGSVIWSSTWISGLRGSIANQERMARTKMAAVRTWIRTATKVPMGLMALPSQGLSLLVGGDDGLDNGGPHAGILEHA